MDKYLDNSLANPTFLFHGSPKKLEVIEQRQAYDSNGIKENEDFAVFMTSSFIIVSISVLRSFDRSLPAIFLRIRRAACSAALPFFSGNNTLLNPTFKYILFITHIKTFVKRKIRSYWRWPFLLICCRNSFRQSRPLHRVRMYCCFRHQT